MGKTLGRPIVRFNRRRPGSVPVLAPPPALPGAGWVTIEDNFDAEDIYDLAIRRAGPESLFVEVTGGKGRSSSYLAERTRDRQRVSIVHTSAETSNEFEANMERVGVMSRIDIRHQSTAAEAAKGFSVVSKSFVFLDVPTESIEQELAAWWPMVEQGGLLAGTGYGTAHKAVDAFVAADPQERILRIHRGMWMVYRPMKVDAIYCINLPARTDRRQAVETQFRAAGILDRVEFFDAVDGAQLTHPRIISNGQAGCLASHLAVVTKAREADAKNILVFEDDVQLVADFANKFRQALSRCPATYDILYVGAICVAKWGHYLHGFDDGLGRAGRLSGAHAYMINTDIEPRLRQDLAPMRTWYDEYLMKKLQPEQHCYVCLPYLASQKPSRSDVSGSWARTENFSQYVYR
jgi:hypothetical protein